MKTIKEIKTNYVNLRKGEVGQNKLGKHIITPKPDKKRRPLSELSLRLHQNNIDKMNLNKMVCVKDTTTSIVERIPQGEAQFRVDNSDGLLKFVEKKEYKEFVDKKYEEPWDDGLVTKGGIKSKFTGINRKGRRFFIWGKERKKRFPSTITQNITRKYNGTDVKTISQPVYYWEYELVDLNFYEYERHTYTAKSTGKVLVTRKLKTDRIWSTMQVLRKSKLIKEFEEVATIIPIVQKGKRVVYHSNTKQNMSNSNSLFLHNKNEFLLKELIKKIEEQDKLNKKSKL